MSPAARSRDWGVVLVWDSLLQMIHRDTKVRHDVSSSAEEIPIANAIRIGRQGAVGLKAWCKGAGARVGIGVLG